MNSPAHEGERMVLLGRGLQKRGTNDSIALACVTSDDCSKAQFVRFLSNGTYELLGQAFEVPQASDEKLQAKAERLRLKHYLVQRLDKRKGLHGVGGGVVLYVVSISGLVIASVLPETTPGIVKALTAMAPALILAPDINWEGALISKDSTKMYTATHDQTGWNWSEDPKVIGRKRYERFLRALKSAPQNTRQMYLHTLEQKIRRLHDQGVYFGCMDGVICYEGFPVPEMDLAY